MLFLLAIALAAEPLVLRDADVEPIFDSGALAAAKSAYELGSFDEAAKGFARSTTPEARYMRAISLVRGQLGAEAVPILQGLKAQRPKQLEALGDRIDWWLGQAFDDAKKWREAAAAYAAIPTTSLVFAEAQLARAADFDALGDRAQALAALEPILGLTAPADATRGDAAAEALLLAGRVRAESAQQSRVKVERGWARRAFIECWSGHPLSRVAQACMTALKALPAPFNAPPGVEDTLRRAESLLEANRNRLAMVDLEELARTVPSPAPGEDVGCRTHFGLGRAYRKERLHTKAIATLRSVVERCEDKSVRVRALYVLASSASIATPEDGVTLYLKLSEDFPDHPFADDALFYAADLQARAGKMTEAQLLLTQLVERYSQGDFRAEALFKRAWIEKRLGNVDLAQVTLGQLADEYRDIDTYEYERATYWRARLLAQSGSEGAAVAKGLYATLAANHPVDYYGILSLSRLEELDPKAAATLGANIQVPVPSAGFQYNAGPLAEDVHFRSAVALMRLGLTRAASDELNALDRDRLGPLGPAGLEPLLLLAELLDRIQDHRAAHNLMRTLGKRALQHRPDPSNIRIWHIAYPKAFRSEIERWAPKANVPVELMQALMREESALDPYVISPAGAIGLTQLMLPTANGVARKLKLKKVTQSDLMIATLNIRIGSAYLGELLRKFAGSPALALASYNAGDGAVRSWLRQRGSLALDEFVEEIPIQETRGYVKRVLRSYAAYRLLYSRPAERSVALTQKLPSIQ